MIYSNDSQFADDVAAAHADLTNVLEAPTMLFAFAKVLAAWAADDDESDVTEAELARVASGWLERYQTSHAIRQAVADESDAADLLLVQVRAVTDSGNRTPLADVLDAYGLTEADLERG